MTSARNGRTLIGRGKPRAKGAWAMSGDDDLLDELNLVPFRLNGAVAKEIRATYSRDLSPADVAALTAHRGVSSAPHLVRLRSSHHSVARCLAAGMKGTQVALVTGYTPTRISILQNDPAFQSLVNDYKEEAKGAFADLAARMTDLSLDAIEELQARLHENPETFSVGMLLDVVKTFADRTGHGPGAEVNLTISPTAIDRPPRESREEWEERRRRELTGEDPPTKLIN